MTVVHRKVATPPLGAASPIRTLGGVLLSAAAVAAVAIEHGFVHGAAASPLLVVAQIVLSWFALVASSDLNAWRLPPKRWTSRVGVVVEPALAVAVGLELAGMPLAAELAAVGVLITLAARLNGQLARSMRNPSLLFPASFLVLIAVSTALLKLPAATPPHQPIGWVDAAFTSTSAVCVTGLGVRDTASGFTPFGQAVIAASIQLGGLGVMIFGSTLALLFGARLSHKENMTLSSALNEYPAHRISRFVWFIVLTTLALEAVGAGVLYALWPETTVPEGRSRAWLAAFHSISAFCNAGFDITGQSMIGVRGHALPYLGVIPLIIMGGLGFVVLEELFQLGRSRLAPGGRRRRLSTHSRLVVSTTAWLILGGAAVFFLAQLATPGGSFGQRLLDALFMSTTARTAGFTSVPMEELASGSRLSLMMLMFVGGSPGSTAGGIKTVVFALLVLGVVSTVRGREDVEVFGRALPDALVKRAGTVAFGMATLIAVSTLILDMTETITFEWLLFEVISAATTTGLSLGATAELTPVGRCVVMVVMFLGRVGPLAVIASLVVGAGASGAYRFPRDTVSLG